MATVGSLVVDFGSRTQRYKRGAREVRQSSQSLKRVLVSLAATAGAVFGGRALLRGVVGALRAWGQQEEAVQSLRAALMVMGHEGEGALRTLTKRAAELQKITTKGDEAIIAATASIGLLAPALRVDELARAQEAMIGIADTFLKGDVTNAALLMGKSIGSATNALTRYGIQIDVNATQGEKLNQIVEQSVGLFVVSKARTDTLNGALQQMKNAWGDVREAIGRVLEQKTGLTDFLQGVTTVTADVATGLSGSGAQIEAVFKNLGVIGANAFSLGVATALVDIPRMFRDMFAEMVKTGPKLLFPINAALAESAEGWRLILEGFFSGVRDEARANIGGAILGLEEIAKAIQDAIEVGGDDAADATGGAVAKVVKELSVLEAAGVSAGRSLIRGIIQGIDDMGDFLRNIINRVAEELIIGGLEKTLKIRSPSLEGARIGRQTVAGYVQGLQQAGRQIQQAVGQTFALPSGPSPAFAGGSGGDVGGGVVVHQVIEFNITALDGPSVAQVLRSQKGTIAQIVGEAAQDGAGFRRTLRGR